MVKHCGGFTMDGSQTPTQLLSFPLLKKTVQENKIENLMGQNTDRKITYYHDQNRLNFRKINLLSIKNRAGW